MKWLKQSMALLLCSSLVFATVQGGFAYQADSSTAEPPVQAAQQTPEELQQLVAPIALYPDSLVAQILAASTYPTEVVEADRWMQRHSDLKGERLAREVDTQPWDPSVKALTQFPSVLANLDKNLSWTSALGDAYVNQEQDVSDAIQVMRQRARRAGNLRSTAQETVTTEGQTIVVEPANPEVVYVPEYDPWVVYGAPLAVYPGWVSVPGLYLAEPGISFGIGFGVGWFSGFGWGWPQWGFDWRRHRLNFHHNPYFSHSSTFINRHDFYNRNHFYPGRPNVGPTPRFHVGSPVQNPVRNPAAPAFHGPTAPRIQPTAPAFPRPTTPRVQPRIPTGAHSSVFSGFDHGGVARGYSMRGQSSIGGGFQRGGPVGGGFGGAGGMRGGGFHGGGGRR